METKQLAMEAKIASLKRHLAEATRNQQRAPAPSATPPELTPPHKPLKEVAKGCPEDQTRGFHDSLGTDS